MAVAAEVVRGVKIAGRSYVAGDRLPEDVMAMLPARNVAALTETGFIVPYRPDPGADKAPAVGRGRGRQEVGR